MANRQQRTATKTTKKQQQQSNKRISSHSGHQKARHIADTIFCIAEGQLISITTEHCTHWATDKQTQTHTQATLYMIRSASDQPVPLQTWKTLAQWLIVTWKNGLR